MALRKLLGDFCGSFVIVVLRNSEGMLIKSSSLSIQEKGQQQQQRMLQFVFGNRKSFLTH